MGWRVTIRLKRELESLILLGASKGRRIATAVYDGDAAPRPQ